MTEDLLPACLKRIEMAVKESRGLTVLSIRAIVLDGHVRVWRLEPTQYEPFYANRAESREQLLDALADAWIGKEEESNG